MSAVRFTFDQCFMTFPQLHPPEDLAQKWQTPLLEMKRLPMEAQDRLVIKKSLGRITFHEIRFRSTGKAMLDGILAIPRRIGSIPLILSFHDYLGTPALHPTVTEGGAAHLAIRLRDHRAPSVPSAGAGTPSPADPSRPSLIREKGMEELETSYLFHLYLDAVRSVDFAASLKYVDPERIALHGTGIGAAMALFAAFHRKREVRALSLVRPQLPWIHEWLKVSSSQAAEELRQLFSVAILPRARNKIKSALDYLDPLNWSEEIHVPCYTSAGLEDEASPPRPIFGFFHHLLCDKTMDVYPEANRDPDGKEQERRALEFLVSYLANENPRKKKG